MLRNDQLAEWDRENFFHPSTHLAQFARGEVQNRVITGGSGCHIEDQNGTRLLDAFAGLYCVNVGYGRQEIAEAIAKQARELAYYHAYVGHGTEASITLAKMILDRAPDHMSKVYFGLCGSDANETNVKLIWYYNNILGRPEKKKIISRWRGYHGSGLVTGSLTGLELFHKKFDLPLSQVVHTEAPYYFRRADLGQSEAQFVAHCVAELEALIAREGADTIAAFIGEPVFGHWRSGAAARGLLGGHSGSAGKTRHPAGGRRSGDRVWPTGQHVRIGSLRAEARSDHHRQGADQRLCAAVGQHRQRKNVGGSGTGHGRERTDRPWLDIFGASHRGSGGRGEPETAG